MAKRRSWRSGQATCARSNIPAHSCDENRGAPCWANVAEVFEKEAKCAEVRCYGRVKQARWNCAYYEITDPKALVNLICGEWIDHVAVYNSQITALAIDIRVITSLRKPFLLLH